MTRQRTKASQRQRVVRRSSPRCRSERAGNRAAALHADKALSASRATRPASSETPREELVALSRTSNARVQRFSESVLQPGYTEWHRRTASVTVAAEGAAGGVYFFNSDQGEYRRVVVKPLMDEGPEQSQFGDEFLRAMGIHAPASKIVERGRPEFTQLEALVRPHWPGQPDDLSLTDQWGAMTEGEKQANIAAVANWRAIDQLPAFKVMGLAKGESLSGLAAGGQAAASQGGVAQADVDRLIRLLTNQAFLRNLGETMIADAAMGNDDRVTYGAAIKVNLGNIMVANDDSLSAIDTAAALKRVDAKTGFDPTAFNAATLLRTFADPARLLALVNAFFAAVRSKVLGSVGVGAFSPINYYDAHFQNADLANARGFIQGGINSGLVRLNSLLTQAQNKETRAGLKAEAAMPYVGTKDKASWQTLKANYSYYEAYRGSIQGGNTDHAARTAGEHAGQDVLVGKQYRQPWETVVDEAAAPSLNAISWKAGGRHKWLNQGLAAFPPLLIHRTELFVAVADELPTVALEAANGPAPQQAVRQQQRMYALAHLPPAVPLARSNFTEGWKTLEELLRNKKHRRHDPLQQQYQQFMTAADNLDDALQHA